MDEPIETHEHLNHFVSDLFDKLNDDFLLNEGCGRPITIMTHRGFLTWLVERNYLDSEVIDELMGVDTEEETKPIPEEVKQVLEME